MDSIQKIIMLESHLGQKETAKRLGVSARTLQNWKKAGQIPKQKQEQKLNRVYGANKRYISDDTTSRAERKIREYDVKQAFSLNYGKASNYSRELKTKGQKEQLNQKLAGKNMVRGGRKDAGQIIGAEPMEGKPAGVCGVRLYGVFSFAPGNSAYESYTSKHGGQNYEGYVDYYVTRDTTTRQMDFEEALFHYEQMFYERAHQQHGRRRDIPVQFIGFEIVEVRQKNKRKR